MSARQQPGFKRMYQHWLFSFCLPWDPGFYKKSHATDSWQQHEVFAGDRHTTSHNPVATISATGGRDTTWRLIKGSVS